MIITENRLDAWVTANSRIAQGVIVELVLRLVKASCPNPEERHFPLGDSINQPGEDGLLVTEIGFPPFVPNGKSLWEIGTGGDAGSKATKDYKGLTQATDAEERRESTFVFVTPLSGTHAWQRPAQKKWISRRVSKEEWLDVSVIDGTDLVDWLCHFPGVEKWLADQMNIPIEDIETPEERWQELKSIGDPPPLVPEVFMANRDKACKMLGDLVDGNAVRLKIDTYYPPHAADFVSAFLSTVGEGSSADNISRCLIISSVAAWNLLTTFRDRHIFVADFDLDDSDTNGIRLLERAKKGGHSVIFTGTPGGVPNPNRASLPNPKINQIREALEKAGYAPQRARMLAQKTGGDLSSLLRCLQSLSLMPEWAEGTSAAELAIAELIGSWDEKYSTDKAEIGKLSGKAYGEWIGEMREIALRPGTPLIQREGAWKFVSRYEGWFSLGRYIFDSQLERLKEVTVQVLSEKDPKFELSTDQRYMATIQGKAMRHSHFIRQGLAETLALLGSHPAALSSCSQEKPEATAILTVREILDRTDWCLWASLDDLMPLLAEAAPREFLGAVEKTLESEPCPFDEIFAQEGDGITGANYMTGLLWALETLAWDPDYLTRVIYILGELAAHDPGGSWSNRPGNSLSTILLPWHPQTCAPVSARRAAVRTLIDENHDVSWNLLLSLLPQSHQMTTGSRKPEWRELIPEDWKEGVTRGEYWEQIDIYADLAVSIAKTDLAKLADLINRIDDLPPTACEQLLDYLTSREITSRPEADRIKLWNELFDLVSKHKKFAGAKWALSPEQLEKIGEVVNFLKPSDPFYRDQRLFKENEHDLFGEKGKYEEQREEIEELRQLAINKIFEGGGIQSVLDFASIVEAPWRVGFSFGMIASGPADLDILPNLLNSEDRALAQFAGAYVRARFTRHGWQWVDNINISEWNFSQMAEFLAFLPFTPDAWTRSAKNLGRHESEYWTRTNANPYDAREGLDEAVNKLIAYGRPNEALRCLYSMHNESQSLNTSQVAHALLALPASIENISNVDIHEITDLIKYLQDDSSTDPDELFSVEWAFLAILDHRHGAAPKLLEQRMADEADFYCEVIRLVFRSKNQETNIEEAAEDKRIIAENAYRLLSKWSRPPGLQKDGSFNGELLRAWLQKVRSSCSKSGHLEVALIHVGHVLTHVPPDSDGLWIHDSAAAILNLKNARDMRDGFSTELYNSRGVFWVDPEAKEERELAAKYRCQADEVEARGYHRLANTLRELAENYEREAQRRPTRYLFD